MHHKLILAELGVEPARASIGVQLVDIGSTMSIEPRTDISIQYILAAEAVVRT